MANRLTTWSSGNVLTALAFEAEWNNIYIGTIDRSAGRWGSNDDIQVVFGSSQDAHIAWNTSQTTDLWYFGVDATSRTIMIAEAADIATDRAFAAQSNPTLLVCSADAASTTEYLMLQHNGTDAVVNAGSGSIDFNLAGTTEATISTSGLNLITGDAYSINGTSVLNATTLGSGVTASSLTSVGTLVNLTVTNAPTFSALTSGRIPIAGTAGLLGDDADLTFATDTLSATKLLSSTSVSTPLLISTGAVGITPASGSNLNVTLATTGDFAVNTSQLYVDTSVARVGINQATPLSMLHLTGDNTAFMRFEDSNASGNVWLAGVKPSADYAQGNFGIYDTTGSNPAFALISEANTGVSGRNDAIVSGWLLLGTFAAPSAPLQISTTSISPTANAEAKIVDIASNTIVEAGSGTHAKLLNVGLYAPTITAGGASVTATANLYIDDAPNASGASNYALWVDAGESRFDGTISSGAAMQLTPASGSNLNVTLATTGDLLVNTNQLVVDTSAGNVGIGATPSAKFWVNLTTDQNVRITSETYASIQAVNDAVAAFVPFKIDGLPILLNTQAASNVKLGGTAARSVTEGTNQLFIFNGTAPSGTLTNGGSIYSNGGELTVMDAAGNATPISPHDHTPFWVFKSRNTVTGKSVRIEMEKLMKRLNEKFGEKDWFQEIEGDN